MRKKKLRFFENKRQLLVICVCLCFFIGNIIGNVMGFKFEGLLGESLFSAMDGEKTLGNVFITYFKYIAIMWTAGFFTPGVLIVIGILLFRGMCMGFEAACIYKTVSQGTAFSALLLNLPKNLFLTAAFLISAYSACYFLFIKYTSVIGKGKLKREKVQRITEYIILLAVSVLFAAIGSKIEVFVAGI